MSGVTGRCEETVRKALRLLVEVGSRRPALCGGQKRVVVVDVGENIEFDRYELSEGIARSPSAILGMTSKMSLGR
jgi:hypothetical protein